MFIIDRHQQYLRGFKNYNYLLMNQITIDFEFYSNFFSIDFPIVNRKYLQFIFYILYLSKRILKK